MKEKFKILVKKFLSNFYLIIALSLFVFAITLILSLNIKIALLVFFISFYFGVVSRSFSAGWLLILLLVILFPSVKIHQGVNFQSFFLFVLSISGIIASSFQQNSIYFPRISRFFIGFGLVFIGFMIYAWFFRLIMSREIISLSLTLINYWIIFSVFGFFFQTIKRIKKFLSILVFAGTVHAMFGLLAFILVHQFFGNLGVSFSIIDYPGLGSINYHLNGFLGDGFLLKVGVNALAPLLLITSSVTLGFILSLPKKDFGVDMLDKRGRFNKKALIDSAFSQKYFDVEALKKELVKIFSLKLILSLSFFAQALALFLTFSFLAMISFSLGFLIIGILLRKKIAIYTSTLLICIFALFLPSINDGNLTRNSVKNINSWLIGLESVKESWVMGNSLNIDKNYKLRDNLRIYNSYLFIWSTLGIAGLLVFLGSLLDYFFSLFSAYKKSEGERRVWLIIIISIFFQLLLFSIGSNSLIFGPAALVFWLLYSVAINLRKKNTIFGLTETKLDWN